jgi:O-antigen ligase
LLPLFRSVAIALGAGWILFELTLAYTRGRNPAAWSIDNVAVADDHSTKPGRRAILTLSRPALAATMIVVLLLAVALLASPSAIGKRLLKSKNVYSRLVTWEVGMRIASIQPLFGVGLTNYDYYFRDQYDEEAASLETELSTRVARGPHSNPIWILSELGIAGLLLYLAANFFLLRSGWRAFRHAGDRHARLAAGCFLGLLLAYWIPGLALASGEYSDLNLYAFFLLGLLAGTFGSRGTISSPSPQ